VQQIFPIHRPVEDPHAIYDALAFPDRGDRAYLFANMVASFDGRAQVDGRTTGLGSPVDQILMRRLRAQSDCVLNGAGTISADNVYALLSDALVAERRRRGQADQPLWAMVTASGQVPLDDRFFHKPTTRPIVFAAERTPTERRERIGALADVVIAGDERPDPVEVLRVLRHRYGCRRVLTEGGPTFNMSTLRGEALDEIFLTFAPKIVAGEGKTVVMGSQFARHAWPLLEPVTIYEHEAELFLRYRVRHGARDGEQEQKE
jgi:riboflavin-specific deaminase-like protein